MEDSQGHRVCYRDGKRAPCTEFGGGGQGWEEQRTTEDLYDAARRLADKAKAGDPDGENELVALLAAAPPEELHKLKTDHGLHAAPEEKEALAQKVKQQLAQLGYAVGEQPQGKALGDEPKAPAAPEPPKPPPQQEAARVPSQPRPAAEPLPRAPAAPPEVRSGPEEPDGADVPDIDDVPAEDLPLPAEPEMTEQHDEPGEEPPGGDLRAEEYAQNYIQTRRGQARYDDELPGDEEADKAALERFSGPSKHDVDIGRLVVGGRPYFYKGGLTKEQGDNEVLAGKLARAAGVPMPRVRASSRGGGGGVLTSWVEGDQLAEIQEGFNPGSTHDRDYTGAWDYLKRIVRPDDVDRHILFGYLVDLADSHLGNYIVSGDRLVRVDCEVMGGSSMAELPSAIRNNDLFIIKHDSLRSSRWREDDVPLDRGVAKELGRTVMKLLSTARSHGAARHRIDLLDFRSEILLRYGNGSGGTFGSFKALLKKRFPEYYRMFPELG